MSKGFGLHCKYPNKLLNFGVMSLDNRQLFLRHVAQTSPAPLGLEVVRAEGLYLYDPSGTAYMDLIGGISVCNTGHRHPRVVQAIREQTVIARRASPGG